jgi:cysteinyl-tRNA synthetase
LAGKNAILEAINENLDTPKALAQTDEIFLEISKTPAEKLSKSNLVELLEFLDELLGLDLLASTPDISEVSKQKILQRRIAREQKDWATSDQIRDELLAEGIVLRDTPSKTIWEFEK